MSGRRYGEARTARVRQKGSFAASAGVKPKSLSELRWKAEPEADEEQDQPSTST